MNITEDQILDDGGIDKASPKSYMTAVILSGIFGILGIHHFYVERWGMGIFDFLLSIIGFGLLFMGYTVVGMTFLGIDIIHTIIVTYLLLVGQYKDGSGKIIAYPGQKLQLS